MKKVLAVEQPKQTKTIQTQFIRLCISAVVLQCDQTLPGIDCRFGAAIPILPHLRLDSVPALEKCQPLLILLLI